MSLDRSLKSKASLARHRNVLSRAERIARLRGEERWKEEDGVLGLPKVSNIKPKAGRKKAKDEATAAEGTAAAPAAGGAAAAPAPKDEKKK